VGGRAVVATVALVVALSTGVPEAGTAFPCTPGAIAFSPPTEVKTSRSTRWALTAPTRSCSTTSCSRDGSRIAFTDDKTCFSVDLCADQGLTPNASIYRGDAINSGSLVSITENESPAKETETAWYPSRLRIAYTSDLTGSGTSTSSPS
jgi:WD40-like Beta Propeller Repeat